MLRQVRAAALLGLAHEVDGGELREAHAVLAAALVDVPKQRLHPFPGDGHVAIWRLQRPLRAPVAAENVLPAPGLVVYERARVGKVQPALLVQADLEAGVLRRLVDRLAVPVQVGVYNFYDLLGPSAGAIFRRACRRLHSDPFLSVASCLLRPGATRRRTDACPSVPSGAVRRERRACPATSLAQDDRRER